MLPDLPNLLQYKNINVLKRYSVDYPDNLLPAEQAFAELMKFFWLSLKHAQDKRSFPLNSELDFICGIHTEMKEIDDMWHTFLLFTRDYQDFCQQYFGKFFHHLPTPEDERLTAQEFELDFTRYLSYVYDHLGEQNVIQWFGALMEPAGETVPTGSVRANG